MMFDRVVQVIADIIRLVAHGRVFLKSLDAPTAVETCTLTCTPDLLRSMRTFAILVQTCIVRRTLRGISKTYSACGRYRSVRAPGLFILPLISFVLICLFSFLFSLTGCVVRLDIFIDTVA